MCVFMQITKVRRFSHDTFSIGILLSKSILAFAHIKAISTAKENLNGIKHNDAYLL